MFTTLPSVASEAKLCRMSCSHISVQPSFPVLSYPWKISLPEWFCDLQCLYGPQTNLFVSSSCIFQLHALGLCWGWVVLKHFCCILVENLIHNRCHFCRFWDNMLSRVAPEVKGRQRCTKKIHLVRSRTFSTKPCFEWRINTIIILEDGACTAQVIKQHRLDGTRKNLLSRLALNRHIRITLLWVIKDAIMTRANYWTVCSIHHFMNEAGAPRFSDEQLWIREWLAIVRLISWQPEGNRRIGVFGCNCVITLPRILPWASSVLSPNLCSLSPLKKWYPAPIGIDCLCPPG